VVLIFIHFIQDIDIIATYSDTSGAIRISRVKMRDLSASWVWENPMDVHHDQSMSSQVLQFELNVDMFSDINNVCGSTQSYQS
jgi:hypothetical protein